jgi:hypothetical protein
MQLKFGSLPKMNDFTERTKYVYLSDSDNPSWKYIPQIEKRLKYIKQISLTQDGRFDGYAINAMWGHYADAGEGCCLVLNKGKIIECCKAHGFCYANVKYNGIVTDIIYDSQYDIESFIKREAKNLFYSKSPDWKYEQEFRIINLKSSIKGDDFLDISGALMYIIIHTNSTRRCAFDKADIRNFMIQYPNSIFLEFSSSQMWGNSLRDINGNPYNLHS